jgi:hypothetical protein
MSHINQNQPTSMRRLFRIVANPFRANDAEFFRGGFHVKWTLYDSILKTYTVLFKGAV